jgi:hypothetical protein
MAAGRAGGSLAAAGASLGELGRELEAALIDRMLNAASMGIKVDALRIAAAVSGGDRRLSRFGSSKSRGRVRMNVGYDILGTTSTVKLRPAGLWVLTNGGARPHPIGAGRRMASGRYVKARKGRRLLVLPEARTTPGHRTGTRVRTAPLDHPGTAGKGAVLALYAAVPEIVAEEFSRIITERIGKL